MSTEQALPPHVQLIEMSTAYWVSRLVHTAARLGLADMIDAPISSSSLAAILGLHGPSFYRFLRSLASLGLLTESDDQHFALTPLGAALKTGAPGAARACVLTICSEWYQGALDNIMHSLRTGETSFEKANGMPLFEYLAQRPEDVTLFNETMVGFHGGEPPAVAAAYDVGGGATIADIGGATGNMLAALLARHPESQGVLFDLPHVVAEAPTLLKTHGVSERVRIEAGSFFEEVPSGADLYILSHVIHDWNEAQCLQILGNVRAAMKPTSKLLVIEMVLPAGDAPHPGKMLDMAMLTVAGGQERTEAEYRDLLGKAGFRLTRTIPTQSAASIVEAVLG